MVICVSMLVGSTFAWFTDSATANVNAIKSGDLDVEIVKADGSELTGARKWVKAAGHENETILWEPGCQYNLEGFKIINKGNLAFKYKVVISGLTGDSRLLEVIKFTVKIGDAAPVALEDWDGKLLPAGAEKTEITQDADIGETAAITIIGEMDKNAGNDYKNLTLDGIVITVYATQMGYESDSDGPDYDNDATYYPVIDAAGLKTALALGGDISVEKDVPTSGDDTLDARIKITKPTNLNLKGKIISPDNMGNNNTNFVALMVAADTTIDASANGGIDTGVNGGYAINVLNGAKLTINSGYYYGGGTAVQVQKGELVINGGFFAVEAFGEPYGYKYLLNCVDAAYKDGTAKITVYGGTFVNFDPSDSASENPHGNFVAEGYTVISETQENGDVWYTVVKEGATIRDVASADDLKAVAAEVKSGDIVRLTNDITVSETIKFGVSGFTFDGNGHTITTAMTDYEITKLNTLLSFGYDSTTYCTGVTVKNVKFAGKGGRAMHFHGGSASTLENVTISGEWSLAINFYGTHGAVMTNCNISSSYANKYCKSTIFANEQSSNQIVLKGTTIDSIFVNATEKGATYANGGIKVIVGSGSTVGTIHTNEGITRTFVTVDGGTVGEILADIK